MLIAGKTIPVPGKEVKNLRSLFTIRLFIFLLFLVCSVIACQRELYFDTSPSTPAVGTPPSSAEHQLPFCINCIGNDFFEENKWNMKADTTLLCGDIDTAIINHTRDAFTFFGPSACSGDTGLVITAFLTPFSLARDTTNMHLDKVSFHYYEPGGYIFLSRTSSPFSLTILTYDHQSRLATGSFEGYAYRQNGLTSYINSGKFKVKFH